MVFFEFGLWIVMWLLLVVILQYYMVCFVLVGWDIVFKCVVIKRMVFDLYGELFVMWIQVWFFGNGLAFEYVVEFQLEVVMQLMCMMVLDEEL